MSFSSQEDATTRRHSSEYLLTTKHETKFRRYSSDIFTTPDKINLHEHVSDPDYDYLFKVLLIGDSGTGKSCLLIRFCEDYFSDHFISTIGVDFKIKTINIDNKIIKLQIWDSAGQERFRTLTTTYYRGAHGIIIVYDVTDRASYINTGCWLEEVDRNASDDVYKVLVGNKSDKVNREVDHEAAKSYADKLGVRFYETSAKDNVNVTEIFYILAHELKRKLGSPTEEQATNTNNRFIGEGRNLVKSNYACCPLI